MMNADLHVSRAELNDERSFTCKQLEQHGDCTYYMSVEY